MGYFANGSEGDAYMAQWCSRCVHWKDESDGRGEGCPVFDLHLLHNYDQIKKESTRHALEMFIPRNEDGLGNAQCRMFWERGGGSGGQKEPAPVPLAIVRAA